MITFLFQHRWFTTVWMCIVCLGVAGCDSRSTSTRSSTTTRPVASVAPPAAPDATDETVQAIPAVSAATASSPFTQAAALPSAFMIIDGRRADFPPAKLRVSSSDGKVVALLYSDDPKDAISDQYTGHSFYFEMELEVPEVKDFITAAWHETADTNDRRDTPYGIFLDGHRRQLQPLDVKVSFAPSSLGANVTTVWLSGSFLLVNIQDSGASPREIRVTAQLAAQTAMK